MSARRLLRQAGWYGLEQGAAIATQLALTAWMIRCLSLEGFGLWILGLAVLNLGPLVSFGLGAALTRHVAQDDASGSAAGWLRAAATLFARNCLFAALLGGLVAAVWVGLMPQFGGAAMRALRDLMLDTFPALPCAIVLQECSGLLASTLRARQRYATLGRIEFAHQLVWALGLGTTAWIAKDVAAILTLLPWLLLPKVGLQLYSLGPEAVGLWSMRRVEPEQLRCLSGFSRWQGLRVAGVLLLSSVDRLLVGGLLGTSTLAVYAVCVQFAGVIARVAGIALQPLFVWSSRQKDLGAAIRRHAVRLRWLQVGIIAGALAYLPPALLLLPWWLGPAGEDHGFALAWAVLASTLLALHAAPAQLLVGSGENRRVAIYSMAGGVLSLLAMALASRWGIAAVMAARCVHGLVLLRCWAWLGRHAPDPKP